MEKTKGEKFKKEIINFLIIELNLFPDLAEYPVAGYPAVKTLHFPNGQLVSIFPSKIIPAEFVLRNSVILNSAGTRNSLTLFWRNSRKKIRKIPAEFRNAVEFRLSQNLHPAALCRCLPEGNVDQPSVVPAAVLLCAAACLHPSAATVQFDQLSDGRGRSMSTLPSRTDQL